MTVLQERMLQVEAALGAIDREANDAVVNPAQFADPNESLYGYWRKPNGWITFHQNGPNSVELFFRGWMALPAYGTYPPPTHARPSAQVGDPYFDLVRRNGLKELPAEQVLALGWHRKPSGQAKRSHRLVWERVEAYLQSGLEEADAVRAVLPQLQAAAWQEHACPLCPDRRFLEAAHLEKHQAIVHAENVRTRELRDSLVAAMQGTSQGQGELIEQLVTVLKDKDDRLAEVLGLLTQVVAAQAEAKKVK